jgi:hypothetical protein
MVEIERKRNRTTSMQKFEENPATKRNEYESLFTSCVDEIKKDVS